MLSSVLRFSALVCLVVVVTDASICSHRVESLPLLRETPNFMHYSGYLHATGDKRLHYWFVESQNSPETDPLVIWFNGGPGCSSMLGFLTENGPFIINRNATELKVNPFSWNKKANVLYIESPAGVGFSYSKSNNVKTGDDDVAENNLAAVKYFFKKYPEFKRNPFHLTGESYAGIYIPMLAVMLAKERSINFKGMMIGNGLYDYQMNSNSLVYFGYGHGLWDTKMQKSIMSKCCRGQDQTNCNFYGSTDRSCWHVLRLAFKSMHSLNRYNMYGKCYSDHKLHQQISWSHIFPHIFADEAVENQQAAMIKESTLGCSGPSSVYTYLNRRDVRAALHVPRSLPEWNVCNFAIFRGYNRQYGTMKPQFLEILATRRLKMLIFNGDVDMACNYLGDEKFVDALGRRMTKKRSAWMYRDAGGYLQVGGFRKDFGDLQFRTVLGSGHMVPTDKPEAALTMFNEYLGWAR